VKAVNFIGPTVAINNATPVECELDYQVERIDVTTISGTEPNPAWEFVDAAGHYHAYDTEMKVPTTRQVAFPMPHDDNCPQHDLDDDYLDDYAIELVDDVNHADDEPCEGWTRYETQCELCGEQIAPGRRPQGPKSIPGRSSWTLKVPGQYSLTDRVSIKVTAGSRTTFFGFAQPFRSHDVIGTTEFGIGTTEFQCWPMARRAGSTAANPAPGSSAAGSAPPG